MDIKTSASAKGKAAADSVRRAAERDEERIEAAKGSALKKGEKRFEERSRSSDGRSAGAKQR